MSLLARQLAELERAIAEQKKMAIEFERRFATVTNTGGETFRPWWPHKRP
jgi:hypothetical protein